MYPSSVILKLFLGKSLKKKLSLCSGLGLVIGGLITLAPNAIANSETGSRNPSSGKCRPDSESPRYQRKY
jgi:hypothetical protein